MAAFTSADDRERLQRIWRSAAYGATPKDLLWLTQQTVRLVAERDRLASPESRVLSPEPRRIESPVPSPEVRKTVRSKSVRRGTKNVRRGTKNVLPPAHPAQSASVPTAAKARRRMASRMK